MIPYVINTSFSDDDRTKIIETMDRMTKLMGGCIEFKHDENDEYRDGGVMFNNNDNGCW